MTRASWEDTWLTIADAMGARSRCTRAQIGAVIVDSEQRIVSTGYNGPPRGYVMSELNAGDCSHWCLRSRQGPESAEYEDCPAVHSEANAIAHADRSRMVGATIYVNGTICFTCAKLVANSGITQACYIEHESDAHREPDKVKQFLVDCGITVRIFGLDK